MHSIDLIKPDDGAWNRYSCRLISSHAPAPGRSAEPIGSSPHLRCNPLRGKCMGYAAFPRHTLTFSWLGEAQHEDLAQAHKAVLLIYGRSWRRNLPYLISLYPALTDAVLHPATQLHAESIGPYRTHGRLNYLACTKIYASMFAMNTPPVEKARALQAVAPDLRELAA